VSQIALIVSQSGWLSFLFFCIKHIMLYLPDLSTPAFEEYCNMWKLTVNTNKTKNVVFSKKKYKTNVVFKIYGHAIDLQDSYSYLGPCIKYYKYF
jgi:hypothetical protein